MFLPVTPSIPTEKTVKTGFRKLAGQRNCVRKHLLRLTGGSDSLGLQRPRLERFARPLHGDKGRNKYGRCAIISQPAADPMIFLRGIRNFAVPSGKRCFRKEFSASAQSSEIRCLLDWSSRLMARNVTQ